MTFTRKILLGLVVGVVAGLFFGESVAFLNRVGEAFVGLLQMTVLPYIVVSLVTNIGRVTASQGKKLIAIAGALLAALLTMGVLAVIAAPIAFPTWKAGSFFSSSLLEVQEPLDLIVEFIPSNPFFSLANNIVPAVVLFSIVLGVALTRVEQREALLRPMDTLGDALIWMNKLVIRLTPLGVFAIAAGTAGTMTPDELARLQAYVLTYTVLSIVLVFLVLPLLISALTPFSYREFFAICKDTLITIFATAKIIVVLPQLVENVREWFRRHEVEDEESDSAIGLLLPLAYPFPKLGTLTIMMFVPFAAWYLDTDLSASRAAAFVAALLPNSFIAPVVGIPYLLDLLRIPSDMFELFMISTAYTDRVRVVLGAVHLLTLTIVATAAVKGMVQVRIGRLVSWAAISVTVLILALLGVRGILGLALSGSYRGDVDLVAMRILHKPVAMHDYREKTPPPLLGEPGLSRSTAIKARGFLRVGYLPDRLPFAYVNQRGETVGYDVDLTLRLARDLEVSLELARIERSEMADLMMAGAFDIIMSGVAVIPAESQKLEFSQPYFEETLALLVPDHRRNEFTSVAALHSLEKPRVGVMRTTKEATPWLQNLLPAVEIEPITSPRPFLRNQEDHLDAVLIGAESGSAWTLIYPSFSVVIPQPSNFHVLLAYPLPPGEAAWRQFIDHWILVRRGDGTLATLYEYWILGGGAESHEPRWSVIRNVLGWVD